MQLQRSYTMPLHPIQTPSICSTRAWPHSLQGHLLRQRAAQTVTHAVPAETVTAEQKHADMQTDAIQQLQRQAYEAGFKAGYQRGIKVQVSVSLDLDDSRTAERQPGARQPSSSSSSSSGGGAGSKLQGAMSSSAGSRQGGGTSNVAQPAAATAAGVVVSHVSSSAAVADSASTVKPVGDSLARSALKGLVWRVFSTSATVSVALLLLHDSLQVSDALKFGGIEFVTKYVMYFLHERLWAAIALL